MVVGAAGCHGRHVLLHVVLNLDTDTDTVTVQLHNTTGKIVRKDQKKQSSVHCQIVQVSHFVLFIIEIMMR